MESSDLDYASPELATIADFLQQSLPFNELSDLLLRRAVGKTIIHYHCRGGRFGKDSAEMGLRCFFSSLADSGTKMHRMSARASAAQPPRGLCTAASSKWRTITATWTLGVGS